MAKRRTIALVMLLLPVSVENYKNTDRLLSYVGRANYDYANNTI